MMAETDLISRQAAIDIVQGYAEQLQGYIGMPNDSEVYAYARGLLLSIDRNIKALPSAQPEQRWIPFKTRPLTEEEKEEHPEWDCILDCKLPDNGQRILVAIRVRGHEEVQQDEFYSDDGSYLDSGYEIGTEAVAWMPLPEPYKEDDHETD